jgi:hypothetical protein
MSSPTTIFVGSFFSLMHWEERFREGTLLPEHPFFLLRRRARRGERFTCARRRHRFRGGGGGVRWREKEAEKVKEFHAGGGGMHVCEWGRHEGEMNEEVWERTGGREGGILETQIVTRRHGDQEGRPRNPPTHVIGLHVS